MEATVFRRRHLRELLEAAGPAISIYLPEDGSAPNPDRDRLRLRAALERAETLLRETAPDASPALLQPVRELELGTGFWDGGRGGIAIFRTPELTRVFRLFGEVPELVVVAATLHTRPLVRHLQAPSRYWVLELGQGPVRLWRGDAVGAFPVEPSPLPGDME